MALFPRSLSSPGVSAFINACCIFFLLINFIQNYFKYHSDAISQHNNIMVAPNDHLPPPVESRQTTELNDIFAIGIPRGKAV